MDLKISKFCDTYFLRFPKCWISKYSERLLILIQIYRNTQEHQKRTETLRHLNTGLVSRGVCLTSWGEGAPLVLVGHPSSDGITIKTPYGVDVLLH